jgi:peptide/nickel transport system permease protein
MWIYIIRRLLYSIPILIGVTAITFLLLNVVGGNPVVAHLGKSATPVEIAALEKAYGLDQPLWQQYLDYLWQIATFEFGDSWKTKEPVVEMLWRSAGPSLSFTVPALILTTILAVTIAMIAAFFRGRRLDRGIMGLAVLGMSISFLVYIVVGQYVLAYLWPIFHIYGYEDGWLSRW